MDPTAAVTIAPLAALAVIVLVVARLRLALRAELVELCGTEERGAFWTHLSLVGLAAGCLFASLLGIWWVLDGGRATRAFVMGTGFLPARVAALLSSVWVQAVVGVEDSRAVSGLGTCIAALRGALVGALVAVGVVATIVAAKLRDARRGVAPCPPVPIRD